nr:M20/M25/M40 family metallo-hydrolase [Sphingobium boeckii]
MPFFAGAAKAAADPQDARFLATYKELIETDTSLSQGSCTIAARKMLARLKAAGYGDDEARLIVPPAFPKQGNLIAQLTGRRAEAPAILLVAHIDVVEAKRSDWQRDPFLLVEEDGYFYGRGTVDDKAMAASFIDMFVRYRTEGYLPDITLKLALTCGEETYDVFNGVQYLLANAPDTLEAGVAINEGGNGYLDTSGKPMHFGIQSGEKIYQDFRLVTTSPGGHSARPGRDNAITRLADGLSRIGAFEFPVAVSEVVRKFFMRLAPLQPEPLKSDMAAIGSGRADDAAFARISAASPEWNAMLRTTCVSTLVNAGHAANAMAQHAEANVNCRILPGQDVSAIRDRLVEIVADPSVRIEFVSLPGPVSSAPALTSSIMAPVEKLVAEMWPGVPVIPNILTAGTDGRFLLAAGIPTYGISAIFRDPDGNGVHGLNERVRVKSLMDSRTFLYRLVKSLGGGQSARR